MQTWDEVEGLLNCLEFFQPLMCISVYVNMEKVFYCLNDDYALFLSLYFALTALFRYYLFRAFNIVATFAPT